MSLPKYSFVILSYNSENFIQQCLTELNSSIEALNELSEVFIVDNGSKDNTIGIINGFEFCEKIKFKLISFDHNTGTTYSRNLAIKECTGEFIVIMDSDAYINQHALKSLSKYLGDNQDCGLAVPKIIYPDGRYQLSTDCFPTLTRKVKRYLFLKSMEKNLIIHKTEDVDYAISAFWMLSKKVVDEIGLLDEKIFYSPEDVDYCIRIWKNKYRITYIHSCEVIHDAREISRPKGLKLINLFSLSHIKGLLYLYNKHKFLFSGKKFRK